VAVFVAGAPSPPDRDAVRRVFDRKEIPIEVDLGIGTGAARAWGTDLSEEYVRINADYTT
jgi:glutamate N-acetyltransferase/amino-acid N-acetyltransferase